MIKCYIINLVLTAKFWVHTISLVTEAVIKRSFCCSLDIQPGCIVVKLSCSDCLFQSQGIYLSCKKVLQHGESV